MSTAVKVASASEPPPGTSKLVEVNGQALALFNVAGKYFAIDNACPHAGGPLNEGDLDGNVVTCPWHGAQFDVTTGKVLCEPAHRDVESYPVTVEGGGLLIKYHPVAINRLHDRTQNRRRLTEMVTDKEEMAFVAKGVLTLAILGVTPLIVFLAIHYFRLWFWSPT